MAKPIEPTPVLKGEDAERFYEMLDKEERQPDQKRIEFIKKSISVFETVSRR
jgi:hypothetical protein